MRVALDRAWRLVRGLDPRLVDGAVGAVLAAPAVVVAWTLGPFAIVLIVLLIGPLTWRRAMPLPMYSVQTAAMLAATLWARPAAMTVMAWGALLLGAYSIGVHGRPRVASFALVCATTIVEIATIAMAHGSFDGFWFLQLPMFWLIGNSVHEHGLRMEREKAALMYAAAADERARIARDMHDVVAHSVSVMVLQAEAARKQLVRNPERAGDALQSVSAYGREALTELRHMLGLLRDADAEPSLDPQPRLGDVDALVEQVRGAGYRVGLRVEGRRRPLAPGVDVTGFRVIQEALTNALRHAPSASTDVLIRYSEGDLLIEVEDRGDGELAPAASGSGRGLLGMRERVAIYGGQMEAGPRPGGGYRLQVRLPGGIGG